MKKTTRTARKVLSVFLSVLMILTTLTVAAPGIALAADTYYVRVYLNIYDGASDDGYGNAYTVVTDSSSEYYGKPNSYSWKTNAGYYGNINMAGFTLFYDNDKKYKTYDLNDDLVAATTTLGNKWTSMDELTLENFADCQNKVEKVYTFELDSIPSSLFWINDEDNGISGETSFGFHKITVAESSTGAEHILWTGLSGSESYYNCYYGTITPTGIITPWDDCPGEDTKTFYKDYTTSAVGTWIDPYNAGDYNVYPVNNYLSGGVSAAFTVGNSGSQTNIDFVDVGNTNNYYINFTNHSTQDATFTLFKAENKALLNGYYDNYPIPSGKTVSFALNKASMGGDGTYTDFSFKFKLDNVYNSDGTTQSDFYQAAGIGSWNTTDDSSEVGYPDGETSNKGMTVNNDSDIDVMNQFAADVGIFETLYTNNNRTDNVSAEYNYWIDTSNYTDWSQTGLRLYVKRWNSYKIHLQSSGTNGTMSIGGEIANSNASLGMADLATTYTSASDQLNEVSNWAYIGTTCTPFWQGVDSNTEGTLYSNEQSGVFRYAGNIFQGSTTSTNPATITFNNMTWVCPAAYSWGTTRYGYFTSKINVYAFDKTDLRNYVYNLGGLGANWAPMRNRFSDAQWNAYETALKDAKEVLANQKTNQKAVTDAYNALYSATEALKSTASLKSQVAEVTYTQRESDYASAAVATTEKYILMPVGTETAVPGHDAYKYATTGTVVGKQSSNLKTNYTTADTDIDPIDYRYWKIDFAGVDEATEKATAILNAASETYSDEYYEKIYEARNSVSYFDRDSDTWTPTHQSDISDPLANLNALLAHTEDGYDACVYDGDDEDTEADIVNNNFNCIEGGTVEHVCIICGKAKVVETKDPNEGGHTVESWTKVDENNHSGTCTVCGETVTESHTFVNPVLTRPTFVDGAWTDGYYTYTCVCGETKTELAERADYSELEEAVEALEEIKNNENLSDEAKAVIEEALKDANDLADDLVTAEQGDIDALVKELKEIKADADEAIKNKELGVNDITEATSGVKVQFIDASGLGTIDSVQLGEDEGFIIRVANGNADSDITITSLNGDAVNKTLGSGESTDFAISADGLTAGIATYTITYTIDGLKDAEGNPVEATTKAYLYVKDEAYNPYHFMDEQTGIGGVSKWDHYVEATNYGDFTLISENTATKFSDKLESGTKWYSFGTAHTSYDYDEDGCQAGCTTSEYKTGDGHAATYGYFVDTSLAPTWQAAGFRLRIVETEESTYQNAPLKTIRVANDQTYLDGIKGDDKTFTLTFYPSATGTQNKTWAITSTGTLDVATYANPDEDNELLFGEHKNRDGFDENTVLALMTGEIPSGVNEAKFMLSPRIEFNGTIRSESVTMTSHIYLTSYDKADLRDAVTAAETAGYNSAYFDAETYAKYEEALMNAKEVLGKAETNQTEVDAATAALNTAIDNLSKDESEAKFVLTVTHSIHNGKDRNSENPDTSNKDYYLLATSESVNAPLLSDTVLATYNVNKHDDAATFAIENNEDTNKGYHYWYIDYSGVQDAIDAADAIIDDTENGYSEEYKQKAEDAKDALQDILDDKDSTTTPESQVDVNNAIDAVTALTGHTCNEEVEIPAEAPTCEDDGLTAGAKCSVCGKITVEQTVTDALGHSFGTTVSANAATCLAPGNVAYKQCTVCKLYFAADAQANATDGKADTTAFTLAQLAHAYTGEFVWYNSAEPYTHAQKCVNGCGKANPETTECTFETTTEAPTCTEGGTITHTCTVCKNSYETYTSANGHTWNEGALTRPELVDGAWVDGYYTYTCEACGTTKTEPAKRADYTAYDEAKTALEALLADETLTTEAKTEIENLLEDNKIADNLIASEQDKVNAAAAALKAEVEKLTNEDGTLKDEYKKPDYTEWDKAETAYDALTEEELANVKTEIIEEAEALKAEIAAKEADETLTQATATQEDIDEATARLNEIVAGINDGTLVKPDYSGAEEAIEDAKEVADSENIPDDTEAEIEAEIAELEEQLNEIKDSNPSSTDEEVNNKIAEIEQAAKDIIDTYGECAKGNHTDVETDGDHNCDICGKLDVTSHNYVNPQLTRPVYDEEKGEWSDGYYTSTCNCGDTSETTIARADYEAYDKAVADLNALLETGKLTQTAVDMINAALEANDILDDYVATSEEQDIVDDAAAALKVTLGELTDENGLKKEYEKVDYSKYEAAVNAYENLKNTMTDADKTAVEEIKAEIAEIPADGTAAQYQTQVDKAAEDIAKINAKYGDCATGNHTWGEPVLTKKPTEAVKGEYTETCGICGKTQITKVDLADYSKLDAAVKALEELAKTENLTDEAKTAIEDALEKAENLDKNLPADVKDGEVVVIPGKQGEIDALVTELEKVVADTNTAIGNGSALKPDYTAWELAEGAYDALDKTNVKGEIIAEADALKAEIAEKQANTNHTQATATQVRINEATTRLNEIITEINGILTEKPDYSGYDASHKAYEELVEQYGDKIKDSVAEDVAGLDAIVNGVRNDKTATKVDDQPTVDNAKTQLDAIIAGIKDGSLIKPADFTNVNEDLETAKELASKNDVIGGVNDSITNIEKAIDDLEKDTTINATAQDVIDALEKQLEAIIEGINNGSLVKPDLTDAEADLADAKDKAEKNDVIDGVDTAIENLENALDDIENDGTATKADDQDDVEAIEKALEDIIAGINDGSLVKPDYDDAEQAITNAESTGSMTDEDKKKLEDLKKELEDLKKDPTTNKKDDQTAVNEIKDAVQDIVDRYAECELGNHNWGEPELTTAPTADAQGEYTETCGICGATQIIKVDLANYDAFDDAVDALEALLGTANLTDTAKAAIEEALEKAENLDKNLPADVKDGEVVVIPGKQGEIDDLVAELNKVVTDTNAGIADGSLVKPDYTEVDKDLADAKDKAENNNVIDGVKDDIKDIEDKLNEIKNDPETNKAEHQDDVDALEKELEDIIAGIEDGSLVKPDYTDAENAVKEAEKDLNGGKLSDEDQKALDDLKDKLDEIKNDPTSNYKDDQGAVDSIKDAVQEIVDRYSECAKGNHAYETKTVLPTCTEKGYDLHTCKVCGKTYKDNYVDETGHIEVVLEAVEPTCSSVGLTEGKKCEKCGTITVAQEEIPMLRHTDADGDGVCDVCGKGGLYDGCTCLCHNNHWFWRLVYLIIRIIWRVFRIHQICPCGAVHF